MRVERVCYGLWRICGVLMTAANAMELLHKNKPTLEELIERCTDANNHAEIDFGTEGNEII